VATGGLSAGRYLLGVVALAVVVASLAVVVVRVRRRWLPAWAGAPARLAEFVIGFAVLTAVLQVLGAVGLFRLGWILAACAGVGFISWRGPGWPRRPPAREVAGGRSRPILAALALTTSAAVTAQWISPVLDTYAHGTRSVDSLWYHLPWAASFAQSGSVLGLRFTDIEYLTAFYPAGAELFHGFGIVLFGGDLLSPLVNLVFLAGLLLAAWCCGLPFGLAPLTLLGGALSLAVPMVLLSQAGSAGNDVVGVCFLLAAVALLLNAPREPAALALAAVAAGLAVSVKLSLLAPVAALTLGVLVWQRSRRSSTLWLGPLLLAGGYWYLRNLIAVGNPLPWLSLPGLAVPAAPLQAHTGFSIAHYLGDGRAWHGVLSSGLLDGLGPWWPAMLVAIALGPLSCLLARDGRLRLVGGIAAASILAYIVTPETAAGPAGHPLGFAFNLRYSEPALTLSLVAVGLAPAVLGANRIHFSAPRAYFWLQFAVAGALTALLAAALSYTRWWPSAHLPVQLAVAAAVLAAAAAPALTRHRPALRRPLALGAAAFVVLLLVLGHGGQRDYFRHRYTFVRAIAARSEMWALFRSVHGARVGIVGTYGGFFAYPLFGVDDSNRVSYLAHRGPHGSLSAITSCPAWRAAVNAARLDYLVTTPGRDPWRPHAVLHSPERRWTATDPAVRVVFSRSAGGQPITVFRIRGSLNPGRCPVT
jgi:hypothetical protein